MWRGPQDLAEFEAVPDGMTRSIARGNSMQAKVLEAVEVLRLRREENQRALAKVRWAVERAEPFSSYDGYVGLADRALSADDRWREPGARPLTAG